jgi:Holliday junction resolvase RusA-like endonuclease
MNGNVAKKTTHPTQEVDSMIDFELPEVSNTAPSGDATKPKVQVKRKRSAKGPTPEEIVAPGWDGGIRLDLTMPTSVNAIWRRSRFATYISPAYKNWMAKASAELEIQRAGKDWRTIEGPFDLAMMLPLKKRFMIDLDNRVKATLDWAQKAGLVANDKFANRILLEWGPVVAGVRVWLVPAEIDA